MHILLIGYSTIVRKRVLPALVSLNEITKISIATRQNISIDALLPEKHGKIFNNYYDAIDKLDYNLAYISLPNSLHAKWVKLVLNAGKHVIVDKPAFIYLADTIEIVELAKKKSLLLAEANVWFYHPIAAKTRELVLNENQNILSLNAIFTSPPLNPDNFRYKLALGSGVILDRGPYAVSCARYFFGNYPQIIDCSIISIDKRKEVDISINIRMQYKNGATFNGFFSLNAEYRNSVEICGSSFFSSAERVFTPPSDYNGQIFLQQNNEKQTIRVGKEDCFALFIKDVCQSISKGSVNHFSELLLSDSKVLNKILESAKGG